MSKSHSHRAGRLSAVWSRVLWLWSLARPYLTWPRLREYLPWVNSASIRRRAALVMPPYKRVHTLWRALLPFAALPLLSLACLVYGFFFGLTAPYMMVPFAAPIGALGLLVIWALPDQRSAPTLGIEVLFLAYVICLVLWPDYLAIALPGLPWITTVRLIGLPMAALLLVSLSVSRTFFREVVASVTAIKPIWYSLSAFWVLQFVTIFLSSSPGASANLVLTYMINWTCIFVISCLIFRKVEFVERYWGLLCCLAIPICIVTTLEYRGQNILWAKHLPGFLQNPTDPTFYHALQPVYRPGTMFYRAKAIFKTPLVLAEFLGMLTPFFLHFATSSPKLLLRIGAAAMLPVCFVVIRMTDARLGLVAMLVSTLLYGLAWSYREWRSRPQNLFSTAIVFASPAAFIGGIGFVLSSHSLKMMVLGGNAQASSNAARSDQLTVALGKVATHPWGYGPGQAGLAMGYGEGSFVTIDNYFIAIILDYGVIGVTLWYSTFLFSIYYALRYSISAQYIQRREGRLLMPLGVALCAFLVVKWVHGQYDLHSTEYMMLGMVSALVLRLRTDPVASSQ
jgi:hypothetical protein